MGQGQQLRLQEGQEHREQLREGMRQGMTLRLSPAFCRTRGNARLASGRVKADVTEGLTTPVGMYRFL